MDKTSIGRRIAELRRDLSLKQSDLAERLGIANVQTVSDIERGRRELRAWELLELADLFSVSPKEILDEPRSAPVVHWRGQREPLAERALARRMENARTVAALSGAESSCRAVSFQLTPQTSFEDVSEWADEVNSLLRLGAYPARSTERALEDRWNVKVYRRSISMGSAATAFGRVDAAILLNLKEPWWRQNFSLAHEVFHLVTENGQAPEHERLETLANVFASHLLVPEDSVEKELHQKVSDIRGIDLIELARRYMVSTEALMWRLCNPGMITQDRVEEFKNSPRMRDLDRLMKCSDANDLRELPESYVMAAYELYIDEEIAKGKLADLLETSVGLLPEVLTGYGIDPFDPLYGEKACNT